MILLKILLLFLFCDNFIQIKAQLNKCVTPEGNEGFCMNIWECKSQVKYLFSSTQNSLQTYNILKSICDYTNSTIMLCCPSSSDTGISSSLQENENENIENVKVHENYSNQNENSDVYINNEPIKRQDLNFFKNNTICNEKSTSNNNTEAIITKSSKLRENLILNEFETVTEPIISKKDQYDGIPTNVTPFNEQQEENSATEMQKNESAEHTDSSNINCKTNSTELNDNNENLNDTRSELLTSAKENNEVFEIINQNKKNNDSIQEMEYDYYLDSVDTPDKNISVEFKVSMNSDNQIKNNTFIIINMRDKSTIFNNNNNSTVSVIKKDNNGNTANSSKNKYNKINKDLLKKILCAIFGKNYSSTASPQDNSDKSLETNLNTIDTTTNTGFIDTSTNTEFIDTSTNTELFDTSKNTELFDMSINTEIFDTSTNTEIFDMSTNTEIVSVELASEASNSLENINSSEFNSLERQNENIKSIENSTLEETTENINSSESNNSEKQNTNSETQDKNSENQIKNLETQIENLSENGTDFNFFISDESEEVYVSLPNPPYCGKNRKYQSRKGEYSWQVLLKEKGKKSTKDFCRGTLITQQHIVTTAYCIKNREIEAVLVYSEKVSAYITLKIKDVKVHEHFEPHRIQNDIALIKLSAPIQLEKISPICLKIDSNLTKNLTGIVAYSTGYLKNASESVQKAEVLISEYECINELDEAEDIMDINENVLCTKSKATTEDVCLGNEGSPLMIRGKSDNQIYYYQIGVVSEVNRCNTLNNLGIFVNINLYLNWLLKNM